MKKYIFILFIIVNFVACTSSENSNYTQDKFTNYNNIEYFDYYEISNNEIIYTSINDSLQNYASIISGFSNTNDALTIHTIEIDDYNLTNVALDINETFNTRKLLQYNATTNNHMSITYKENYGRYELYLDYCLINSDIDNCKTYIYIRH